jgi:hypothetical protein
MFRRIRGARSVERFLVPVCLQPTNKNGPVLADQLRVNVIFLLARRRRSFEDVENQLEALPLDSRPPAPPAKNLRLLSRPESTGERCGDIIENVSFGLETAPTARRSMCPFLPFTITRGTFK